jgi:ferredoxin
MLHVYDQPKPTDVLGTDFDIQGRLAINHIEEMIAGSYILHGGRKVDMPLTEFDIYMCGPPIFQDKIQQALITAGANATRLFQESFQANMGDEIHGQIETAQVVFSQSGKTVTWHAESDNSLLDLAESVGLTPDNACRMGVCQSCSAVLKEGKVYYGCSLTHMPDDGQVLLCCAKPASEHLIIEL